MLYTVNTDIDGFVLSIAHTPKDNVELDLLGVDTNYLAAYQLDGDILVLNQERYDELKAVEEEQSKQEEISELKEKLNETDYIMARTFEEALALANPETFTEDFMDILGEFNAKYADRIANRKIWRARIEELEK